MSCIEIIDSDLEDGNSDRILGYISETDAACIYKLLKAKPVAFVPLNSFKAFGPNLHLNHGQVKLLSKWLSDHYAGVLTQPKISRILLSINLNVPLVISRAAQKDTNITFQWD